MGGRSELMTQADKDAGAGSGRSSQQQLVSERQHVVEARHRAIKAAWIMHRGVASLYHCGDPGGQHIRQPLRICHAALPDRVEDGVGVGDLLHDVGDVLGGPHGFSRDVDAHVLPGLYYRDAVPEYLRQPQQQVQLSLGRYDLFQGRCDAPLKQCVVQQDVPAGERTGRCAVLQEVAQQGVDGLGTGGVLAENARLCPPAQALQGDSSLLFDFCVHSSPQRSAAPVVLLSNCHAMHRAPQRPRLTVAG